MAAVQRRGYLYKHAFLCYCCALLPDVDQCLVLKEVLSIFVGFAKAQRRWFSMKVALKGALGDQVAELGQDPRPVSRRLPRHRFRSNAPARERRESLRESVEPKSVDAMDAVCLWICRAAEATARTSTAAVATAAEATKLR